MPYAKHSTSNKKAAIKMQITKDMTGLQKLSSEVQKKMGYTKNPDGSAIPMKGPYKMYGQEVDPRTTSGSSLLAKYGCTRK